MIITVALLKVEKVGSFPHVNVELWCLHFRQPLRKTKAGECRCKAWGVFILLLVTFEILKSQMVHSTGLLEGTSDRKGNLVVRRGRDHDALSRRLEGVSDLYTSRFTAGRSGERGRE